MTADVRNILITYQLTNKQTLLCTTILNIQPQEILIITKTRVTLIVILSPSSPKKFFNHSPSHLDTLPNIH